MGRGPKGSGKRAAGGLAERGRASLLLFFSKLKILKEVCGGLAGPSELRSCINQTSLHSKEGCGCGTLGGQRIRMFDRFSRLATRDAISFLIPAVRRWRWRRMGASDRNRSLIPKTSSSGPLSVTVSIVWHAVPTNINVNYQTYSRPLKL
jgi:hypothetical protein